MASAVRVRPDASAPQVLEALGVSAPNGLVVVFGGTAEGDHDARLASLLEKGVAAEVLRRDLAVVTGGTDAGIFKLLGRAFDTSRPMLPFVGVVPDGAVTWPNRDGPVADDAVNLEPHHSHFVLVRGGSWGDETSVLVRIVAELARQAPAVAILASGGAIAKRELLGLLQIGVSVIVLSGTGRLADDVAAGALTDADLKHAIDAVRRAGRLEVLPNRAKPADLAKRIDRVIRPSPPWYRRRSRPQILRQLPRPFWRAPDKAPWIVEPEAQKRYPELTPDFTIADSELLRPFRNAEKAALEAQNNFRLVQLGFALGAILATSLGAIQTANAGKVGWLWLIQTVLTALLGGTAFRQFSRGLQQSYFNKRLEAESLRGEYFKFMGRMGLYDVEAADLRRARLADRVQVITK